MSNDFYSGIYNPDVLSCLANLSNDEVFTPPEVANSMLDMLPQELFSDPNTKFLDPACKSGVFLREIAKRLLTGLEPILPDLQQRIDHIFHHQLYGIAITELTSLLSRRGVYCSKYPNSVYSDTFCQGCLRTFFAVIQNQTLDFVAHGFFARFTEMDFDAVGGLSDFLYHYRWRGFLYGQRGSGCGGAAVAGVVVHRLSFP